MAEQLFELGRRTFDTPQFRGMEFIEVEAKSILNKVPGNRLPFNWTINPYRGCSHSCSYCLWPDAPILMADGRLKAIKDLAVGDAIYGTEFDGKYRRYVHTEVLAHWQTTKRAYRVRLADGTELIASADHRFLTDRGWKHVVGAEGGPLQRPFLTTNNKLMGLGRFADPPKHDDDYRRGYLCGIVRGDGSISSGSYLRPGATRLLLRAFHHFRLALAAKDAEAMERTHSFLGSFDITAHRRLFAKATDKHQAITAIYTSSRSALQQIEGLIAWPSPEPSVGWMKGFLAGIFDAEGSHGQVIRIHNTDMAIIDMTRRALDVLGFEYVMERQPGANKPVHIVRVTGCLDTKLRFFHTVDPAITRKRTIDGRAIKCKGNLRVVEVKDLGFEMPMYDITTGTGDFIANGVVSHNCFARVTHTYLDLNAGRDFDTKIFVKVNAPQLVRKELRKKSWKGESVAMGTGTDPYQRAEGKYRLMPGIIEALTEVRNPFSILTKGTLILRDLDLLAEAASVADVTTAFSVATVDDEVWRRSEPGTPHPRKRLEAVKRLNEAGVQCGVLIAPILPGISDSKDQIRAVVEAALSTGATHVSPILLHLRPVVKDVYMAWLHEEYPELVPMYEDMYRGRSYAPNEHRAALAKTVRAVTAELPHPRPRPRPRRRPAPKEPEAQQLSFL